MFASMDAPNPAMVQVGFLRILTLALGQVTQDMGVSISSSPKYR
jgi:hypothetical protein